MQTQSQGIESSRLARVLLTTQCCVFVLACLLLWQFSGEVAGKSALLGGLIAFLPALYFCLKTLRFNPNHEARQIVRSFYRAEAGKLILAAALFALVFAKVKSVDAAVLFAVFFCTQLSGSFAPIFIKTAKASKA
ncbi:hypothetical protein AXE65_07560 [Ventosimonas gracilis]|uniref:ATP synthase F0F1 subunit I n=1 Tax=Ventosimonas gracilis TaxID=1680762 RepID=A0A139SI50_9GAMM|nr:ATP synthase subunit I [Ventosimonas gracilis]KXU34252.1 hypothetical protein AXE65_07560 [Ventosimonas gracilis]